MGTILRLAFGVGCLVGAAWLFRYGFFYEGFFASLTLYFFPIVIGLAFAGAYHIWETLRDIWETLRDWK